MAAMIPVSVFAATLGVPIVSQTGYPNGCWAASGAAVCQYYGASASLVTFASSAGVSPSYTATMSVVQYGLSRYGISSTIYASNAAESGVSTLQGQINIGDRLLLM